ncbi:MAG: cation:proton antiporter [Candidatus Pacebacteria bacterium]|nr:cation:proton antiporter [Candidatus Paceibacterota bacterium]
MGEFYPLFLILFAGVVFSMIFRRVHVPWVVGLILGGILVGPHVFNLIEVTPTLDFIAQIGLIFLMFMAGLETNLSSFKNFRGQLLFLSLINGAIPFIVGFGLALTLGHSLTIAILIGIIFVSSSIAVVIPSLERLGLLHTRLGQSVIMTTVIQDIASLILLSIVLQSIDPVTQIPLYLFYPLLIVILVMFRLLLPKIRWLFTAGVRGTKDLFQQEFRSTFLILVGTVIVFELLGLHHIIAGFFVGLVLSDSIVNPKIRENIHTISYGFFVPVFFILIGVQTDIRVFANVSGAALLTIGVILASMSSKLISGWLGGRLVGFSNDQSLLFGISSIPQLSTTLAVAFSAFSLNLIGEGLLTAMVALSVVTVVISPALMNIFSTRIQRAAYRNHIK